MGHVNSPDFAVRSTCIHEASICCRTLRVFFSRLLRFFLGLFLYLLFGGSYGLFFLAPGVPSWIILILISFSAPTVLFLGLPYM